MASRAKARTSGLAEQRFIVYGACATILPKPCSAMSETSLSASEGSAFLAEPPRGLRVK